MNDANDAASYLLKCDKNILWLRPYFEQKDPFKIVLYVPKSLFGKGGRRVHKMLAVIQCLFVRSTPFIHE